MGSVWKVQDEAGHVYAMKMLRDSLSDDGDRGERTREEVTARERLRREAMALRKVNHPGVCGIVDMELDDALAFIVTEFIEGKTLREDVAANGRYTGDDLERLAGKLISAVKAVHAAGIVHRDIKPANVMVAARGPVLVDFGIAMGEGESHVTRTGLVMGTPGFIAPEIIDGTDSNEATDWWSVASVLGFAATGRPIFGTKPMMAVLEREASGNADLSGLPDNTRRALQSALSPDPKRRQTPDAVLHAITMDALDPNSWQDATLEEAPINLNPPRDSGHDDSGHDETGHDETGHDETAVMRPFDGDTAMTQRYDPLRTTRSAAPLTAAPPTSTPLTSTPLTQTLPTIDNPRLTWDDSGTIPYPQAQATSVINPQTQATSVIAPPVTSVANPPTVPPYEAQPPDTQPPVQLPNSQPYAEPGYEPRYEAPAPFDMVAWQRNAYLSSGRTAVWLFTVPLALLASCLPIMSIAAFVLVLWILLTAGYNTQAQLERETRHGGVRKGGDPALRVVSLPWHLVKAVPGSLLRMLTPLALEAVAVALAIIVLQLPSAYTTIRIQQWQVPLPLLIDRPQSLSGLLLAAAMAISWLLTAFGPHSFVIRLGAGLLRGISSQLNTAAARTGGITNPQQSSTGAYTAPASTVSDQTTPASTTSVSTTWRRVQLVLWLIVCAGIATVLLSAAAIVWFPLPMGFF